MCLSRFLIQSMLQISQMPPKSSRCFSDSASAAAARPARVVTGTQALSLTSDSRAGWPRRAALPGHPAVTRNATAWAKEARWSSEVTSRLVVVFKLVTLRSPSQFVPAIDSARPSGGPGAAAQWHCLSATPDQTRTDLGPGGPGWPQAELLES